MAVLLSEDQECVSKVVLKAGQMKVLSGDYDKGQQWQSVVLELTSGARRLQTDSHEDVMFCRAPTDEVVTLIQSLDALLAEKRDEILFEPSEPSFELSFARTARKGIKVEVWLDAGNGATGIYTWDAAGIRFYTADANIRSFTDELKTEFGL